MSDSLFCIIAPDCKGASLDCPIRLNSEGNDIIVWIQEFIPRVMLLWKNGVISHTSELTAGLSFALEIKRDIVFNI